MRVLLGIMFAVGATLVGTIGKQLVSYSVKTDSPKTARRFKFSGVFITTFIGPALEMAAYGFAPQGLVAPLIGLDIVWNTISAPFTLGERLTGRHVVGSGLVFVGAVLTSVFGPHHRDIESLEWLRTIFISWNLLFYLAVFGSLIGLCTVTLLTRPKGIGDKARGLALGVAAGSIAGNMFFVSAALGLVNASAETGDWSAWANWLPWVVVICAAVVAVSNIPLMTKGLQEYAALFVVTCFEGCHITVACVTGAWILGENSRDDPVRTSVYWSALALICVGLLVIQQAPLARTEIQDDVKRLSQNLRTPAVGVAGLAQGSGRPDSVDSIPVEQTSRILRPPTQSGIVIWASFSGIGSTTIAVAGDSSDEDGGSCSDSSSASDRLDLPTQRIAAPVTNS